MNDDLARAKEILMTNDHTVAAVRGDRALVSSVHGVKPLLAWLDDGTSLDGFQVADRVVGTAAAWFYVVLGAERVYAPVMSAVAMGTLQSHGIHAEADLVVPVIRNREGNGPCPMETAVAGALSASAAITAVRRKMKAMSMAVA